MTVSYASSASVATITLDDGKVNVLSPATQQELNEALDQAVREAEAGEVSVRRRGRAQDRGSKA